METEDVVDVAPSMVAQTSEMVQKPSRGGAPKDNLDLLNIPAVDAQVLSRQQNNPLLAFQDNPYFDATNISGAPMNPVFEGSLEAGEGQAFDLYVNASVGRKADKMGAYVRAQTQSDYRNQNKLQMNVNMRTLHRLKL